MRKSISGFRSYFSTEVVNAAATIVGVILFTRLVTPATYGQYAVTVAAAGVAMALSGEWLQAATLRLVSGRSHVTHRRIYVRALLQLTLASVGLLAVLTLIGAALVGQAEVRRLVLIGGAYAVLSVLFLGTTIYFQATFQPETFARYRTAYAVLRIMLGVAFCLLLTPNAVWLVGGHVAALALLLPLAATRMLRASPDPGSAPRLAAARAAIANFGAPLILWYAASQTLNLSDRFFLQTFLGSTEVGTYSVAYALVSGATTTLFQPLLATIYPRMVRQWHLEGKAAAAEQFSLAIRIYLILAPLILCGIAIFGNDVLGILVPNSYQVSHHLLGLLVTALLLWHAGLYLQKGLELTLRSKALVRALGVGAVVNVAANVLLIPRMGILGAATATLLGYLAYTGIVFVLTRAVLPIRLPWGVVFSVLAATALFVGISTGLEYILGFATPWRRLLLMAPLPAAAYVGVLYVTGCLRPLLDWRTAPSPQEN